MRIRKEHKFKKGAAAFYIVAFSTLVLLVVVVSFATIIISEIERTSNNDLSQSAYDSALAGVEDAKVAYNNYQKCVEENVAAGTINTGNDTLTCAEIITYVENPKYQDCDMVGHILGRVKKGASGEVKVDETTDNSTNNSMQQAYTCTKIQTTLSDYRSTLSSSQQTKVVKVKFDGEAGENVANNITRVRISWYANAEKSYQYSNLSSASEGVQFPQLGLKQTATPPTISLALVQTGESFSLSDFDTTKGSATDRGMVYLVPAKDETTAAKGKADNYNGTTWDASAKVSKIGQNAFLKSNDKTATNLPYGVYCPSNSDSEFACSAEIELPRPIGGTRNEDTFMFVVSLPYGKPSTDFALEFFCDEGKACTNKKIQSLNEEGEVEESKNTSSQAKLSGVQVKVDSTGRANDLYRRVETRLEAEADSSYLSIMGPLELLGNPDDDGLKKGTDIVKCEYNFDPTC